MLGYVLSQGVILSMAFKHWFHLLGTSCLFFCLSYVGKVAPAEAVTLVNSLTLPGGATDLSGFGDTANTGRLGYFSDLYYDRFNNVYYALGDRGPGGGLISYETRVQKFSLDVNPTTGAISNFNVLQTILFTQNGQPFNGLNPLLLNGNSSNLGRSFDPEGFAIAPNGNFYVSDEYGPSLYEFTPQGEFVRAFNIPANLLPTQPNGSINYVDGRPTITTGRQDNRGFEGLALTPDGTRLLAMLQDPLVNEGSPDGRSSRNLRIVVFNTTTGESEAQYIYQLESLADINDRVPGTANDFAATAQGRNIGISAIIPINNTEFLVLERDNRGLGVDDPLAANPIGSKRVYQIDISGATDVSNISLTGTNTLPANVTPVQKNSTPLLDIAALLTQNGQVIPEKLEGLAVGPQLLDGSYALLLGTDNDFSVTQTGSGEQFNVCVGGGTSSQVGINANCLTGQALIPSFLYSFRVSAAELGNYEAIPEPTTMTGLALAGLGGLWMKRRKQKVK